MLKKLKIPMLAAGLSAMLPLAPAAAEVGEQNDYGFVVSQSGRVGISPDELWKIVIAPNRWWAKEFSWTGDSDNLFLDAQAGGCFCERIRVEESEGEFVNRGSVEQMRVIYADPGKVLRMQGALGPLQSEGVNATLTIVMAADGEGTKLTMAYVVGGFVRFGMAKTAPVMDKVIKAQFDRLVATAGGGKTAVPKEDEAKEAGEAGAALEGLTDDPDIDAARAREEQAGEDDEEGGADSADGASEGDSADAVEDASDDPETPDNEDASESDSKKIADDDDDRPDYVPSVPARGSRTVEDPDWRDIEPIEGGNPEADLDKYGPR